MQAVNKMLKLYLHNGFLKLSKLQNDSLALGPAGCLLSENLRHEWLLSNVINRDINIFFDKNNMPLKTLFLYLSSTLKQSLPFGVAEIIENANSIQDTDKIHLPFEQDFSSNQSTILRSTMYISSENSVPYFHYWQRQRKIWWRKFSSSPGRYVLTDIIQDKLMNQNVDINSNYTWGVIPLEKICLKTNDELLNEYKLTNNMAHVITSETNLERMALNMLCDAYDTSLFKEKPREIMRLHRKLAPYKILFIVLCQDTSNSDELKQLAQYLSKLLRTKNISTLFNSDWDISYMKDLKETQMVEHTEETVWNFSDQFGIPYVIVLRDTVLKTGICSIRSRDTTLEEEVHISDLTIYMEQLLRNY